MRGGGAGLIDVPAGVLEHGGKRRFERGTDGSTWSSLQRAIDPHKPFPALTHARDRLVRALSHEPRDGGELVAAIESDPALAIAVVTAARRQPVAGVAVATVPAAVAALSDAELRAVVAQVPAFDFFQRTVDEAAFAEGFRLHALGTQRAADLIHAAAGIGDLDNLRLAALLHDIGKFVLLRRHARYADFLQLRASPEQRVMLERRQLGMDHMLAGGLLARTLDLPPSLVVTVERHHAEDVPGEAAVIRLADMLAHYGSGNLIDHAAFVRAGEAVELTRDDLRILLARVPHIASAGKRPEPPPLTDRQLQMLRMLAKGKRYKQIGDHLGIAESTVRSHVHDTYKRLGVADRAQAVLLAARRGWI